MIKLKDVVYFLNNYLEVSEINDDSWNGLQVEGKPDVAKIAFAENASLDVFRKATQESADLIVVHHGLFWKERNPSIRDWAKGRVETLLQKESSLYAAHLPLDLHKEVGNNAQLIKILGAEIKEEFGKFGDQNVSWVGEFQSPVSVEEIVKKLTQSLNAKCTLLLFGSGEIKTIAVCSGGGGYGIFYEALNRRVDLYLTGDAIDIYTSAKDAKFNVIFAGHYATETVGIRALMEVVKERFGVKTSFVDDPTGL